MDQMATYTITDRQTMYMSSVRDTGGVVSPSGLSAGPTSTSYLREKIRNSWVNRGSGVA
jgi:hypothetical protein